MQIRLSINNRKLATTPFELVMSCIYTQFQEFRFELEATQGRRRRHLLVKLWKQHLFNLESH